MRYFEKAMDVAASWTVTRKTRIILFMGLILFPLTLLIMSQTQDVTVINNFIVVYLAASVILFAPISKGLSHLLALRSIQQLNEQCQRLKEGKFEVADLPAEQGEEHDFLRLRNNLHWMGYAIASREKKLSGALGELADAQQKIVDSIDYASLIQTSFLPDTTELETMFHDHFLLWDQRDKVGGDAYWFRRIGGGYFVGVIDCTGHGVPGAFMTLIVHSLFEKALSANPTTSPAELLGHMNRLIKEALGQTSKENDSDDGMDCGLCYVNENERSLVYAGANIPLFMVERGFIYQTKGDRCGLGYVRSPNDFAFTDHEIPFKYGQRFYLATDGIIDQVGGERGFPFGKRRLRRFFTDASSIPLAGQDAMLMDIIDRYRGQEPRRDDITVLGFEV